MDFYRGKKVLVTGGSAGIGLSAALQLARAGADVTIVARGRARLDDALRELRAAAGAGQRTGAIAVDVTDRSAVRQAMADVIAGLGGLDVVIANAGYAITGWVHELADDVFDEMIAVNYLGQVHVVRAALPHLLRQGHGHICLVSSMLGFFGGFGYTAYSASKYAVRGFAECLRHELRPKGIGVSLFYTPTTKTPGLEQENKNKPKAVWLYESGSGWNKVYEADEVAAALLSAIPRGRFENVVGWDSALMRFAFRHFPRLSRYLNDGELDKAVRKAGGQDALPRANVE